MKYQINYPNEFEWGREQASNIAAIGWGCPIDEPIRNITSGVGSEVLGWINYFVPVSEMAAILSGWVVVIGLYYIASVGFRWIKALS